MNLGFLRFKPGTHYYDSKIDKHSTYLIELALSLPPNIGPKLFEENFKGDKTARYFIN